jgi:hypothetical protein
MFNVDHENNTITLLDSDDEVDISDSIVMAQREGYKLDLSKLSNSDKVVAATDKYMSHLLDTKGLDGLVDFLQSDIFGIGMDLSSSFAGFLDATRATKMLGYIGGLNTAVFTAKKAIEGNTDGALVGLADILGGASGFIDPILPLTYHSYKKIVVGTATAAATINTTFEKNPWGCFTGFMQGMTGAGNNSMLFRR